MAALLWPSHDSRAESADLERRVKAAFLYKFSGYVEWPINAFPRPATPIVIGVAGDKRLALDLSQMVTGRSTGGHPVAVQRVPEVSEARKVHILFIAKAESEHIREWAEALRGLPVLLVTESDGALAQGSMINFISSEGRIRFEVALSPALAGGLRLSSGLLAVAKTVVPAEQ